MKGKIILTVEEGQDKEKWLAVRRNGLGGSDVAAIMGYNPYKSAYALWAEKTGQVEQEDLSDNEYVYWGTKNEPNIADRFEEVTGKKVRRCGTLQDEEYPYFHANVDRLIVGENAGLEIKTAGLTKSAAWKDDEVPDDYYCQCQWYMGVTGAEKWYIAVLIGGNKMIWKEIARNDDFIAEMRETCRHFWCENIIGIKAPEVDGNEATTETLKKQYPEADEVEVMLPSMAAGLLETWDNLKAQEKAIAEAKTEVQNQLMQLMGTAKKGCFGDRTVSWSNQAGRVSIDSKRLKAEHPEIYAAYSKVGAASRRFSVK